MSSFKCSTSHGTTVRVQLPILIHITAECCLFPEGGHGFTLDYSTRGLSIFIWVPQIGLWVVKLRRKQVAGNTKASHAENLWQ